MAKPQTFSIAAGQDVVVDGFSLGSTTLRFEGAGLSASNLLIDQQGRDTVLSFVGSTTRVRLTNFEASNFGAQNAFAQSFQFTPVLTPSNNDPVASLGGNTGTTGTPGGASGNASPNAGANGANAPGVAAGLDNGNAGANSNGNGNGANTGFGNGNGGAAQPNLEGGAGNDALTGTAANETLRGNAGNDTLSGGDGNDRLEGGAGTDLLQGGGGNDTLVGSADATWTSGWAALNAGSPGAPGTGETISIAGMTRSHDVFDGGAGIDILRLGAGNDAIFLDDPYSPTPNAGARIRAVETIEAGDGNDIVDLTSANFTYGNITIDGGAGNDTLWSSAGNDWLTGGTGNDALFGGAGADTLSGGDGADRVDGGRGNDLLLGGAGDDVIFGGAGNEGATLTVTAAYGGGGQSSWAGLNLAAQNIGSGGTLTGSSSANVAFTADGFGASGNQASRPSIKAETGYDPISQTSETVSVAFAGDVNTATVSLAYFYGPQSGADYNKAEQAFWSILNDGAVVAQGVVTANGGTGNQSFTVDPPGDVAFDTLVMWAGPYVSATGTPAQGAIINDSSDFLIRAISTTATVPDVAQHGGNDRIIGGAGNDRIDGGSGTDTSVYSSYISDYVFSRDATGALVVTGVGAGAADGADTLANVEFLEFLNGVVVPTANLGLNTVPDAQDATRAGAEDAAIVGQLVATDADGDQLTFALAANGAPANGTLTLNPDGSYTYTPNANFNGTDSFTYTVSDGKGGTALGTVSVSIASVNDVPTTSNASIAGQEDGSIAGRVTGSDIDGDTLTFALGQGPANGAVTLNADGTFAYVPAANFNGTDTFTYTVDDGKGGTTTGTVSVNVASVNDTPTTAGGAASGNEDQTVTGQLSANDVDGDTLAYALAQNGAPANGTLTLNPNGSYTYTPNANFNGTDSFTYTVSDGKGGTALGTVSVSIASVNDAPTTSNASIAGQEDGSIAGRVTGSDIDGDTLTFALGQGPANGAVTLNADGTFAYVPAANFNGTDKFTYTVDDGKGGTTTGTVSVNVAAVNDTPTTAGGAASGNEDQTVTGQLSANDVDGDTLSFALASDGEPAHGTVIVNADGTYSYTPDADYAGTDSFRYTVTDANGASSTATVTLDVTPVADAPSVDVAFGAPSVDPGTSSVTLANFAASAGYHNSFGYYTLNEAGEPVAGRIVWADVKDHVGATLTVPGLDASRTGFFIVPNGDANNPGRIQDGEPVSFVKGADGKWVAVDAQGNAFAGSGGANAIFDAPALNVGGRVLVTDNAGAGNQNWEDIAVGGDRDFNDVNTNAVWTTDANGTSTYPLTVTAAPSDRDGSESLVGVTLTGIPAGATLIDPNGAAIAPNADGSYTLTPAQLGTLTLTTPPGFAGALAVTATATARDGASTANGSDTASVEVVAGNLGPVTSGGVVAGSEDKATSGTLRAQDPDGDPLTFAIAPNGGPTNGTVSIDPNGAYTYTPRANFNGADSFTYTVSDGNGGTATATVVINVASVNDAPTTAGGTASGDEDTVVAGQLAAADIDGGTLSYAIVPTGAPAHGTVSIAANGAYTYTPNPNFNGTDSFTYRVSDGQGGSVTGTVSVTVNAVNDAPTTSGATLAGREDGSISGRVVAADVDGDAPSFVRGQGPANGSLTMNPDGTFEYVPAPNFNGTDSFTYTVSDGKGGTTTGIVSVDVAAVNDAPTTSGGAATAAEDGSVAGRLMGADVDGDALGFSVAPNGAPAHGTLQINPDGSYVYTPNPDFNGTDSFTYLAADGQGGTAIGTISITVTPGNDAPTTSGATLVGAEDGTIAGRVTGADVDGDAFTFALGQGPANGAVTMNPDGTFSYAPSANFNGVDTFTYTVDDGKGGTTTGTVSVNIAAVNDAPTTSGAVAAGEESTVIAGRLTATDVDGDALMFALAPSGGPTHGTVIVNPDGSYSYTPTPGFAGTDAFAYTVGDGNGGTTMASVVVNVAAVDSTINHTVDGTWPGGWAALNVGSPGVSGTGESVSLAGMGRTFGVYDGGAGNNTLVMADGNNALFLDDRYSPPTLNAPRLANIDTIQLGTGNQLVDLTSRQFALDDIVIQGNGGNDTIWSSAGDDLILAGAGTDRVYAGAGDDTVAGGAGNDHLHGASGTDTGVFSGLISDYVFRQDTLGTIVVTDKRAGAPDGTDTLISFEFLKFLDGTISTDGLGVNRPPVAPNVGAAGTEDTATSGQLVATDADGDVLTFALAANGGPANGGVTVNPDGSYTYTPNANFNGTDSFTYTVSDGRGGISTGTVTVAVAAVNDTPTTAGGAASGNEDQTITGALAASDVDGDTLAYALAPNGAPANGTLTLNPNGSYTYTPNANFNGTDTFTYTVDDGKGGTTTGTVSVNVAAVNDTPTTAGGAASGNEDQTVTGQLSANDVDGDTLAYALAQNGAPANGTLTLNPNGSYTYTPNANFNGTDSFTYTVSDGKGGTALGTVSVNVASVNDVPTTSNASIAGQEDGSIAGRVTGSDIDGDMLTFALGQGPANGAVTLNADGTFAYVPAANFNGTDTFTYTVDDGKGGTALGTVSVNVAAVNDVPTTVGGAASGNEDQTVTGQLSANDVDGDTLAYALAQNGAPANGTLTLNPNGSYTYTPNANFNGTDSFTYTVSDGKGGTALGTVSVSIASVNDVPTTSNASIAGQEDGSIAGRVTGSDIDGDTLTFALSQGPANGAVTLNVDGTFAYVPAANFNGTDTFTYTVDDGKGGTTTGTVSVNVAAVNDTPTTAGGAASGNEEAAIYGSISASDVDGDALAFALGQGPANGTLTLNGDGTYIYVPAANFSGTDSFTYTVSDGKGGTATGTIALTVLPANDAPVTAPATFTGSEDTAITGQLVATDPDGDAITYYLPNPIDAAAGQLGLNPDGSFTFVPNPDWNGQVEIRYVARDAQGAETPGRLYINVAAVNDAPVALTTAAAANEDTVLAGRLTATDAEGDATTFGLAPGGGPRHGALTIQPDGSYTYIPNPNFNGTDTFTYTVADANGAVSTATVAVAVAPVNDAPVAPVTASPIPGIEDTIITGVLTASDIDGDALSYSLATPPVHGSLTLASNGSYTYAPSANYNGSDSFTVLVADGFGGTATIVRTIQIAAVNDAPTTADSAAVAWTNHPMAGVLVATDVEGDAMVFAIAANGGPAHGSLVVQPDGAYVYTPDPGYRGADSFVYTVADGRGGVSTATVSILVKLDNAAPIAANTSFALDEDTVLTGNFGVSDADGDAFTVSLTQGPAHGAVLVGADGTFTYTPGANYNGADSFTITMTDTLGGTRTQTIALDVAPVVDVPYLAPIRVTINEDSGPIVIPIDVINPDGYAVGLGAGVWQSSLGNYGWGPDGKSVVFTPRADASGTANLSVLYWDSLGNGAFVPLTIEVRPVDDGPRTTLTQFAGVEDTVTTGQLRAFDPEGGTIVGYTLASGPSVGTMTINPDGTFAFTPPPDWFGTQTFSYVATDSTGASSTLTGTLTVQNVYDAPVFSSMTFTGNENTLITGRIAVYDPDQPPGTSGLNYGVRVVDGADGHLADGNIIQFQPDGTFSFRPNTNWYGTETIDVVAFNASGTMSYTATLTFVVTPVNSTPYLTNTTGNYGYITTAEDTAYSGNLSRDSITGQTIVADVETPVGQLTYAVARQAQHGTVTIDADGDFVYMPAPNYSGWDTFAYTITDADGGVLTVEANSIYVTAVPETIEWQTSFVADGNHALFGDVADSTGALVVIQENWPGHGTLSFSTDGSFVYTPYDGFSGVDSFFVTAYGEMGGERRQIFITVDPNDAPVVQSGVTEGAASTPIAGQLTATDEEGDALLFTLITPPADGALTLNPDGSFLYQPGAAPGLRTFEYQVADGHGGIATAIHTIEVYGQASHSTADAQGNWTLTDYVRDTVRLTSPGAEGPDTIVGFQAAEDKIDVSALFQDQTLGIPADWAAQLTAQYDATAGGTFIGVSAGTGGGTPDWGVLLVGVNTTLDDLLGQNALTASQQNGT